MLLSSNFSTFERHFDIWESPRRLQLRKNKKWHHFFTFFHKVSNKEKLRSCDEEQLLKCRWGGGGGGLPSSDSDLSISPLHIQFTAAQIQNLLKNYAFCGVFVCLLWSIVFSSFSGIGRCVPHFSWFPDRWWPWSLHCALCSSYTVSTSVLRPATDVQLFLWMAMVRKWSPARTTIGHRENFQSVYLLRTRTTPLWDCRYLDRFSQHLCKRKPERMNTSSQKTFYTKHKVNVNKH